MHPHRTYYHSKNKRQILEKKRGGLKKLDASICQGRGGTGVVNVK